MFNVAVVSEWSGGGNYCNSEGGNVRPSTRPRARVISLRLNNVSLRFGAFKLHKQMNRAFQRIRKQ